MRDAALDLATRAEALLQQSEEVRANVQNGASVLEALYEGVTYAADVVAGLRARM